MNRLMEGELVMLARVQYETFRAAAPYIPLPSWDELPEHPKRDWLLVARAAEMFIAHLQRVDGAVEVLRTELAKS